MATSSIFSEVKIKDNVHLRKLVRALERSKASRPKEVAMTRPHSDMTKERIQKLFGGTNDRI